MDNRKGCNVYKCPACGHLTIGHWKKLFLENVAEDCEEPNYVGYEVRICKNCGCLFDPCIKGPVNHSGDSVPKKVEDK